MTLIAAITYFDPRLLNSGILLAADTRIKIVDPATGSIVEHLRVEKFLHGSNYAGVITGTLDFPERRDRTLGFEAALRSIDNLFDGIENGKRYGAPLLLRSPDYTALIATCTREELALYRMTNSASRK